MQKYINNIKFVFLSVLIGAGLSVALAQTSGTWSEPVGTPPNNNTPAPINVGPTSQTKEGPIWATIFGATQGIHTPALQIPTGAGEGKVLTSDAQGNATWKSMSGQSCSPTTLKSDLRSISQTAPNNSGLLKKIAVLDPGTYTFTGSGQSGNTGGGGINTVFVSSKNYPNGGSFPPEVQTMLTPYAAVTGQSVSQAVYYGKGDPIIYAIKRNGYNDSAWTIPDNTTFTITETKYVYLGLVQSSENGEIIIKGTLSNCGGSSSNVVTPPAGSCSASPHQASMTSGTTYQNTTGGQLMVVVGGSQSSVSIGDNIAGYVSIDSSMGTSDIVAQDGYSSTNKASITFLVPINYYYKVQNNTSNTPSMKAQAWKLCGGGGSGGSTGTTGGGTTSGLDMSDIRSSVEYKTCSDGGIGSTRATCSASCSAGKKIISGSCTSKARGSVNTPWYLYPSNSSGPNTSGTSWDCDVSSANQATAVMVEGTATCF